MELESLNYEIRYLRGNVIADCLSIIFRPVDASVNDEGENLERPVYKFHKQSNGQNSAGADYGSSDNCRSLEEAPNGQIDRGRFRYHRGMTVKDGLLCKGACVVVPSSMQREITLNTHGVGHFGVQKTLHAVEDNFFWVGIQTTVKSVVEDCLTCSANKRTH